MPNTHHQPPSGARAQAPTRYAPRRAEANVLAEVVREHLDELIERCEGDAADSGELSPPRLPAFVRRELEALVACGDPTRGFLRLYCPSCRSDRVVPFSCKRRLCPSCAGRAMNDTAAYLVDRVLIPEAPWRQYVMTFPAPLAVGLCFRGRLAEAVIRICMRTLADFQRARAPQGRPGTPKPAAVVFVQRFSDSLGPWFHLHVLAPDGVFRSVPDTLDVSFEAQPPPTNAEVVQLTRRLAQRLVAYLRRHASTEPDDPLLTRCAEQPCRVIRVPAPPPARARKLLDLSATHDGFSVHAATFVPPNRPEELERLVRYVNRPPVANSRLRRRSDGRVSLTLKRPRNGVRELVFEPVAFLARLAALVTRPMVNQIRYYGPLSSASPLRRAVLPEPPESTPQRPTAPPRPKRLSHAELLARVFLADLLACPCGGRLRLLAAITQPDTVEAILAAIALGRQSAPSARAPPEAHRRVEPYAPAH